MPSGCFQNIHIIAFPMGSKLNISILRRPCRCFLVNSFTDTRAFLIQELDVLHVKLMLICETNFYLCTIQFIFQWLGPGSVSHVYLTYKWAIAILFLVGLVQSIIQNTIHFLEMKETENVYKYFIYLTNNGRWDCIKYLFV